MAERKTPESQRKAQKVYDRNWCFFTCRVQKDVGEQFKVALAENGTNANKLLSEFINTYMKQKNL